MINLSKLEEIKDLRTVWSHEAVDFTRWLSEDDNIALLADAVGLEITLNERESSVGDFKVDIFATETGTDRKIIIENQLGDTDHDHLGKLITYASGKDANVVIWVVKRARSEHRAAIEWLNNHTDENIGFFLCEIKLYRIGNSNPAAKFVVIEEPNTWAKEVKRNESTNETMQRRYDFWVAFQDYAFKNTQFENNFSPRKPSTHHWMDYSIGTAGCRLRVTLSIKEGRVAVEFNIKDDKDLFRSLLHKKDAIENDSGLHFNWRELPEKTESRIIIEKNISFEDTEQKDKQFAWLVDSMLRMKKAFMAHI